MSEPAAQPFESWAVVEIMGHQTYAGFVTEQALGGTNFIRVDVPEFPESEREKASPAFSKLFGASSIYCITPVSEEVARAIALRQRRPPLNIYMPELYSPRALAAAESPNDWQADDDEV